MAELPGAVFYGLDTPHLYQVLIDSDRTSAMELSRSTFEGGSWPISVSPSIELRHRGCAARCPADVEPIATGRALLTSSHG